jgi:tRNA uridine 5-carbamoylmethylation protein Kti12
MNKNYLEQKLIMMRGIPGSGKTTRALKILKELQDAGVLAMRVSLDELRLMVFNQDKIYDKKREQRIVSTALMLIQHGLRDGYTVIVDATNTTGKSIRRYKNFVAQRRKKNPKIEFVIEDIEVSLSKAKRQNLQRERIVPEHVIEEMYERLQLTKEAEKNEW